MKIQYFFVTVLLIVLGGCKTEQEEISVSNVQNVYKKGLTLQGVDFSIATKKSVTKTLSNENIKFIEKINKWEEIWSAGDSIKGASRIKLGFSEVGNLAYFQYDFNSKNEPEQTWRLQELTKKEYGNPTDIQGSIGSGDEYKVTWDMGDGLRVQLRQLPKLNVNYLTYFNDIVFESLKIEYKISTMRIVEQKQLARALLN
jgi:hypothetical protein